MLDLIRKAIRDIEVLNNLQFGNETWKRLRQLDREIDARVRSWEEDWKNAKPHDLLYDNVTAQVFHRKNEEGLWEMYLLLDVNCQDLQPLDKVRLRICKADKDIS